MAYVCLDNMSSWTSPVAEDLKAARPPQERQDDPFPPSFKPMSAQDEHGDDPWTSCGYSLDQPILIPSDINSDMSVTDGSAAEQDDEGASDLSLPPLEALVARQAALRWDKTRKGTCEGGTLRFQNSRG